MSSMLYGFFSESEVNSNIQILTFSLAFWNGLTTRRRDPAIEKIHRDCAKAIY